jgi:transcriptional regulator with XRE-family HTH domain
MGTVSLSAAVGRQLQELRIRAGVPLPRLAKRAGLRAHALRGIEEGHVAPSVGALDHIAVQLGASLAGLVRDAKQAARAPAESRAMSRPAEIGRAIVELPDGVDKLDVVEAAAICHALDVANGNQSAAARLLGLERKAFARRVERSRASRRSWQSR